MEFERHAAGPNDLKCDFCGLEHLTSKEVTTYKVKPHTVTIEEADGSAKTAHDVDGLWAACATCDALVKANDRKALRDRSWYILCAYDPRVAMAPIVVRGQIMAGIRALQDGFWQAKEEYEAGR